MYLGRKKYEKRSSADPAPVSSITASQAALFASTNVQSVLSRSKRIAFGTWDLSVTICTYVSALPRHRVIERYGSLPQVSGPDYC